MDTEYTERIFESPGEFEFLRDSIEFISVCSVSINELSIVRTVINSPGLRLAVNNECDSNKIGNLEMIINDYLRTTTMGGALTALSGGVGKGATFALELPLISKEKTHE